MVASLHVMDGGFFVRIGVTQRVDITAHGERRDALDQQWLLLLEALGWVGVAIPNTLKTPAQYAETLQLDGVLLTGGNDMACLDNPVNPAPERDTTEKALLTWAETQQTPVLGVCRGMQMLHTDVGGELTTVPGHVATRHGVTAADHCPLALPGQVNSYHHYGITNILAPYVAWATALDGTLEAMGHTELPWAGVMWHPERETPFTDADKTLLRFVFEQRCNRP